MTNNLYEALFQAIGPRIEGVLVVCPNGAPMQIREKQPCLTVSERDKVRQVTRDCLAQFVEATNLEVMQLSTRPAKLESASTGTIDIPTIAHFAAILRDSMMASAELWSDGTPNHLIKLRKPTKRELFRAEPAHVLYVHVDATLRKAGFPRLNQLQDKLSLAMLSELEGMFGIVNQATLAFVVHAPSAHRRLAASTRLAAAAMRHQGILASREATPPLS